MRRFLPSWIIPIVLALCCCGPAVADDADAKDLHPYKNSGGAPPVQLAPPDAGDKPEKTPPTLAYAVAVVSAIIVLSIICVPSRKAESSTAR